MICVWNIWIRPLRVNSFAAIVSASVLSLGKYYFHYVVCVYYECFSEEIGDSYFHNLLRTMYSTELHKAWLVKNRVRNILSLLLTEMFEDFFFKTLWSSGSFIQEWKLVSISCFSKHRDWMFPQGDKLMTNVFHQIILQSIQVYLRYTLWPEGTYHKLTYLSFSSCFISLQYR